MSDEEKFNDAMAAMSVVRDNAGINLKGGKLYSMVKDRVEIFRRKFGSSFRIDTSIDYPQGLSSGSPVIAVAKITDAHGMIVASGHAMERIGSNNITTTNPIEMAETSAIGRALACFGLAGGEYASADEIVSFTGKQQAAAEQRSAQPEQTAPVKMPTNTSGRYVPDDHDAVWQDVQSELRRVLKDLSGVNNVQVLGKYWSDLAFFRTVLEKENRAYLGELKAAFAQRNNQLAMTS